jgi:formate-nitrite transporter family protein
MRLWFFVYLGNILGGLVFAGILSYFMGNLNFLQDWSIAQLVEKYLTYSTTTLIFSAALAGWMMGLLAWLVAAARETMSQIFIIWLVTAGIGLVGLPHCIVGNIEMATALFQDNITLSQYFGFLAPVTFGNIIGGIFFVGILKFSHTVNSGKEKDIDPESLNNGAEEL